MGLLDGVGYALGAGADVASAGMMDEFKSKVEQERQMALQQAKATLDRDTNKIELQNKIDAENTSRTGMLSARTDKIKSYQDDALKSAQADADAEPGSDRPATYDDMKSDPAYQPYLKSRGLLDEAKLRDKADIDTGYISPYQAASITSNENVQQLRQEVAILKLDNQYQIAVNSNASKELIAELRGQMKATQAGGEPSKIQTAEKFMERVNTDRKAKGLEALSYEDAYQQANFKEPTDNTSTVFLRALTAVQGSRDGWKMTPEQQKVAARQLIGQEDPTPSTSADKFTPGQTYKDAKGNTATYLGNGKWRN